MINSNLLYHWENGAMGRYQFHTLRQPAITVCTVGTMRKQAEYWVIELRAFDMNMLTSDTFAFYKDYYCVDFPFTLEDLFYHLAMDGKGALLEAQRLKHRTSDHIATAQAILFQQMSAYTTREQIAVALMKDEGQLYFDAGQYREAV